MMTLPYGPYYRWSYYLKNPLKLVKEFKDQAKWMWQRAHRGYADCDVWGLDGYLACWLPEALRQLREKHIGHPTKLTDKQWNDTLSTIERGFYCAWAIIDGMPSDMKVYRGYKKEFDKGMKLFHKHFFDLWD